MKILIANDGSAFGEAAVSFAANVISSGDEVRIVSVVEPAAATDVEMLIETTEDLTGPDNPEAQKAKRLIERSAQNLRETTSDRDVDISTEVLGGPTARTIVEKAEALGADLIILGTHGHGFWKRSWLGSVSDRVAHHAPCSVLIVRDGHEG